MRNRRMNTALFLAYCALMLWLLFDRPGYEPGIPYWEQAAEHDDIAAQVDNCHPDIGTDTGNQQLSKET